MGFDQQGLIWCVFRQRQRPWSYCVCVGGGGGGLKHIFSVNSSKFSTKWGGGAPPAPPLRGAW